jgi:hypothetical protein
VKPRKRGRRVMPWEREKAPDAFDTIVGDDDLV